jgi:hypothetical protein
MKISHDIKYVYCHIMSCIDAPKYYDFYCLQKSTVLTDQVKFNVFINILTKLYNVPLIEKDKVYRYSTKLETDESHQFLLSNWDLMYLFDNHTEYNRKTKRLVYQMIDVISTHFNEYYHFEKPIIFEYVRINQRSRENNNKVVSYTYYDLKLS